MHNLFLRRKDEINFFALFISEIRLTYFADLCFCIPFIDQIAEQHTDRIWSYSTIRFYVDRTKIFVQFT